MRFGNGKLSVSVISKLLSDKSITSKEIDILLWLSVRQDAYGRTFGVKYTDVCSDIGMSHQEYYNCMDKLEKNNFIRIIYQHRSGWDIEIWENVFTDNKEDKKRYLNTNKCFLFSKDFIRLKAMEKKIILKLLIQKNGHFNPFFLHVRTLEKWIGIKNIQLLNSYIKSIKKFFNLTISKKDGNNRFVIFNLHNHLEGLTKDNLTIRQHYLKHKIITTCRRLKAKWDNAKIADLIILFGQYPAYYNLVQQVAIDSIWETGSIEPKLINYIINQKIKK